MASMAGLKRKCLADAVFEINDGDCSPESVSDNEAPNNVVAPTECIKIIPSASQGSNLSTTDSGFHSDDKLDARDIEEGELLQDQFDGAVNEVLPVSATMEACIEKADITEQPQPAITISFVDQKVAELYKDHIMKFLSYFKEFSVRSDDLQLAVVRDENITPSEWLTVSRDFLPTKPDSSPKSKKRKKSKKNKDLFVLDASPSLSTKENSTLRYLSKFIVEEEEEESSEEESAKRSAQTCFNCNGSHSLKDCTKPKDYNKINSARQKMKKQNAKQSMRYHVEQDQVYGHLVPGKISKNLRNALGLKHDQLPPYIYKMRVLGYPPGWIEEAEVKESDLCMFDIEGKSLVNIKRRKTINPEKIIDFPGFNIPMEDGITDDYRHFGVPPYSVNYSKEVMLEYINKMYEKAVDNLEECNMDLDTPEEIVPNNTREEPGRTKKLQDEALAEHCDSPSLCDLESQQKKLLAELGVSTNSNDDEQSPPSSELNITKQPSNESNLLDESIDDRKVVKVSSFGTPILKSASPYSKLPKPDNFSKDVSPVINFENLPNSTGKYEQMTGVLQKVRSTLKDLQTEKKCI